MTQRLDIPLDALNVTVDDHRSPAGTLRAAINLCPLGPEGRHYWSPVETPAAVTDLAGVVAIGKQVRQRFGPLADTVGDPLQTLERLIAVTDSEIYLVDPGQEDVDGDYLYKSVYTFASSDPDRKAQFCQIGETTFIAISTGAEEEPSELLVLVDDQVLEFEMPELPKIGFTATSGVDDDQTLPRGGYLIRYAWLFKDGSIGPPSRPYQQIVGLGDPDGTLYHFAFDIDSYYEALPAYWTELVSGVAIFVSQPADTTTWATEDAIQRPIFHVATISGLDAGASIEWSDDPANIISGYNQLDDQNLLQHAIKAGAVFSYNKRLIVGDVSYDFRRPRIEDLVVPPGAAGTDYYLMLEIELRTANGTFSRFTEPLGFAAVDASTVAFADNLVSYPDRRAERIRYWVSEDYAGDRDLATWDEIYEDQSRTRLQPSALANFAYRRVGWSAVIDLTTAGAGASIDVSGAEAELDHDVNRMLVSSTYQPWEMLAERAAYVGNSADDGIVGFAVNAMPVSEGQFGEYPLYVLCRETVSMGHTGTGDVAFAGFQVVAKRGCVGRHAFTNIDQAIAFVSRDGVWMLDPRPDRAPLSDPLHYNNGISDFFTCLGHDVACGYYNDRARGRRELWVSSGKLTFCFSFKHARWFIVDRVRKAYTLHNGVLYGVSGEPDDDGATLQTEGLIANEGASSEAIFYYVRTSRLYFDAVGTRKRLRRVSIRQRVRMDELTWRIIDLTSQGTGRQLVRAEIAPLSSDVKSLQAGMVLEPYVEIYGTGTPGQGLESISFDYDLRFPHRPAETLPIELNPADPYSFVLVEVPWTCTDGFDPDDILNRPPYLILDDIEATLEFQTPPYDAFEDVHVYTDNVAPYFDMPGDDDAVTLPKGDPNTAPYDDFDAVNALVGTENVGPGFSLQNIESDLTGWINAAPTITGDDDVALVANTPTEIEALCEDPDGALHECEVRMDAQHTIDVAIEGWNGSSWINLTVQSNAVPGNPATRYYNSEGGYSKKRVTVTVTLPAGTSWGYGVIAADDDGAWAPTHNVSVHTP